MNHCERCGDPTSNPRFCSRRCSILTVRASGKKPDPSLDRMRFPTELEKAWVSGFWQGDGSVANSTRNRGFRSLRVSVYQKEKYPLLLLRECWGGSIRPDKDKWNWSACGARAEEFLNDIIEWASPRRIKQIRKARSV